MIQRTLVGTTDSKRIAVARKVEHVKFLHYVFLLEKVYRRQLSSRESLIVFELARSGRITDHTPLYDILRLLERLKEESVIGKK